MSTEDKLCRWAADRFELDDVKSVDFYVDQVSEFDTFDSNAYRPVCIATVVHGRTTDEYEVDFGGYLIEEIDRYGD